MPEGKSLKFQFELDVASFQRVKAALQELTREAQKFTQALQGAGGQGGHATPGTPGFNLNGGVQVDGSRSGAQMQAKAAGSGATATLASVVQQNVAVFKNLAQTGSQSMKGLTSILKQSIQDQKRDLEVLNQALEASVRRYERLSAAGDKAAASAGKLAMSSAAEASAAEARLKDLQAAEAGLSPAGAGAGQQGFGSRVKNWVYTPGQGGQPPSFFGGAIQGVVPNSFGGWMRAGGLLLGGADMAFKEYMANTRAFSAAEATRGSLVNDRIRGMMSGDTKFLMNLRAIQADPDMRKDLASQTGTAAGVEQAVKATKQTLGAIPVIGRVAQMLGIAEDPGPGGILGGHTTMARNNAMGGNALKMIDEQSQKTAQLFIDMAQERFSSEFSARIQAQRVMGIRGLSEDRYVDGKFVKGGDTFSDIKNKLTAANYDMSQYMAGFGEVRSAAGEKAAHRHGWAAMAAQAQGLGGYGNLLGISERMGMGGVLAQAAVGGGVEAQAGIGLGQALLGTGWDPRGMTSRAGVFAAIQGGMGFDNTAQDFVRVQQAVEGLKFGNTISTGTASPYTRGRNLLEAIKVAPEGGSYLQDYMANQMTMEQIIDVAQGKGTESLKMFEDLGGDPEMAKKLLGGKLKGAVDLVYKGGLKKGTAMERVLSDYRASGQDPVEFLKSLKSSGAKDDIETFGRAMTLGIGGGPEAAAGLSKILSGLGIDLKLGNVGRGTSGAEKTKGETQAELDKKVTDTLKIIAGPLQEEMTKLPEAVKKMSAFGNNVIEKADDFIKALTTLTTTIQAASTSIKTGKPMPTDSKAGAKK